MNEDFHNLEKPWNNLELMGNKILNLMLGKQLHNNSKFLGIVINNNPEIAINNNKFNRMIWLYHKWKIKNQLLIVNYVIDKLYFHIIKITLITNAQEDL